MKRSAIWIGVWLTLAAVSIAGTGAGMLFEPAKTRVGIARVHLSVSRLDVVDDSLIGSYEIRVPIAPWMNDRGTVRFDLDGSLEPQLLPGTELNGTGTSELDHRTHTIRCRFDEADAVKIDVDTGDRVLSFRSRLTRGG